MNADELRALGDIIDKLDAMQPGDSEVLHDRADDLLLIALRACGAPGVADAYERARERVTFWYA